MPSLIFSNLGVYTRFAYERRHNTTGKFFYEVRLNIDNNFFHFLKHSKSLEGHITTDDWGMVSSLLTEWGNIFS